MRVFTDYTEEKQEYLDSMENAIFDKTRLNLKFMKLLYPQKKFSLNANLVRYRPPSVTSGIRSVRYVRTYHYHTLPLLFYDRMTVNRTFSHSFILRPIINPTFLSTHNLAKTTTPILSTIQYNVGLWTNQAN